MPFWPFKRKRRASVNASQPLTEKSPNTQARRPPISPPALPRRSSRRDNQRKRRASERENEKAAEARWIEGKRRPPSAGKENIALPKNSVEDITALPLSHKLPQSPHLRPADVERPQIPYNFRHHATSETSMQGQHGPASRPQTLRSKRSAHDGTPHQRRSTKKRKDDHLREEEIRAMSAPIPIPKRSGDGPLRRDSQKRRNLSHRGSQVSLPPEESVHSSMSGIAEQREWEVGALDVFNPRPAIRLSGTPQYASPSNVLIQSPLSRDGWRQAKDKMPVTRDSARKRRTIGDQADDLDASDLRLLMERDAKRREARKEEQQEKLDRKLRARAGRNRGDSDRRRREAEEARKVEEVRQREAMKREQEERRQRELTTSPTAVHPALSDEPALDDTKTVGLGIGAIQATTAEQIGLEHKHEHAMLTTEEQGTTKTGTYLTYAPQRNIPENPFEDPPPVSGPEAEGDERSAMRGAFTSTEAPLEDPIVSTAHAVGMSHASTPPVSPMQSSRNGSGVSNLMDLRGERIASLPEPPPLPASVTERRTTEPKERRAGAWATFFRRGGANLHKTDEARSSTSEFSFTNTSRESMSRQAIPAYLTGEPVSRSRSDTPTRTQSKFREDLPEMPISPPDSRVQSPDVSRVAAAAATRRARRSPKPIDILEGGSSIRDFDPEPTSVARYDTPINPSVRGHGLMSASLASVDSEGSWLASGSQKRASTQSALSRGMGSLSKRKPEFAASYEELGGDKDAEYFQGMAPSLDSKRALQGRGVSSPALAGAPQDEESEDDEAETEADRPESSSKPVTVHESVRRQPKLVRRDPRVKSRQGLLAEYAGGEDSAEDSPIDPESPETRMQKATSVHYGGGGHARQMSAGSAKLLDIVPKKQSMDGRGGERRPTSMPPSSKI